MKFDLRSARYSPFCVQAKIIKLVGLKNGGRLSPINLVTFAGTQNGDSKRYMINSENINKITNFNRMSNTLQVQFQFNKRALAECKVTDNRGLFTW